MLKMRLTRMGAKDKVHYRVVVQEARSKRDGRFVENLGYYNPRTQPSTIVLKMDRVDYWIGVGAQPTDSVASLLRRARVTDEATEGVMAPAATLAPVAAPVPIPAVPAPVILDPAPAPLVEVGEVDEVTATPDA